MSPIKVFCPETLTFWVFSKEMAKSSFSVQRRVHSIWNANWRFPRVGLHRVSGRMFSVICPTLFAIRFLNKNDARIYALTEACTLLKPFFSIISFWKRGKICSGNALENNEIFLKCTVKINLFHTADKHSHLRLFTVEFNVEYLYWLFLDLRSTWQLTLHAWVKLCRPVLG